MRNFMACTRIALVSACLLALASVHAAEDASEPAVTESADTPLQAISQGRLLLQLRPRYAYVDQSNKADAAEAWTMRSLLGWQTRAWADTSAQVQVLNVGHLGPEHYVTGSAPSPYPQVKDPDNTDINRLYVDYAGIPGTTIRVGRQDLILDNERMVGAKNFSQTSQVFDAATFRNQSFPGTTIFVGQFWRERTTSATDLGSSTSLLNLRWGYAEHAALSGYAYFQDQADTGQNTGFADNSNRIAGVRLDGAQAIGLAMRGLYTAEFARQNDYAGGDARIDCSYSRLGAGFEWNRLSLRADRERLGSNHGLYAFQTPIGSTHSFQGWADLFTTTPKEGLVDDYATLGFTLYDVAVHAERHRFHSDINDIDFGSETDVRISYPLMKSLIARLELADYNSLSAAAGKPDTRKIWVTLLYNY